MKGRLSRSSLSPFWTWKISVTWLVAVKDLAPLGSIQTRIAPEAVDGGVGSGTRVTLASHARAEEASAARSAPCTGTGLAREHENRGALAHEKPIALLVEGLAHLGSHDAQTHETDKSQVAKPVRPTG